jgi:menaquinone-dependent protoporphyrinogen oxidase
VAAVLVAYASKHGSTAEIAAAIADVLREEGHDAEARAARDVRRLDPYAAVVLGSALYAAHWQRDAVRFVRRHVDALRARPVWLFSSGPLDRSADAGLLPIPEPVAAVVDPVVARAHRTFGGRLLPGTPGVDPHILGTHPTGDFRDWEAIRAWARSIAAALDDASPGHAPAR